MKKKLKFTFVSLHKHSTSIDHNSLRPSFSSSTLSPLLSPSSPSYPPTSWVRRILLCSFSTNLVHPLRVVSPTSSKISPMTIGYSSRPPTLYNILEYKSERKIKIHWLHLLYQRVEEKKKAKGKFSLLAAYIDKIQLVRYV